MGKCETSTAAIGIKILLSELILQINETNFNVIMEMIKDGFIEDDNDYFNEVYENIIWSKHVVDNTNVFYVKEYLTNEFKTKGSITKYKFGCREDKPTLDNGCLFDKYLLVPVKEILRTNRWGYDRYGTNSSSRPMDFDLSVDIEKYIGIKNIRDKIVFLLVQHSS
jgi:hypothetical protein